MVTGSGILWAGAGEALRAFIDATGIPFFTTPQGRGAVPEDHPRSFPAARTLAFREADVVLAVGTRANFIVSYFMPPRWSPDLELLAVNLDESELGSSRPPAVGMLADARAALEQLAEAARGRFDAGSETPWIERLRRKTAESDERQREAMQSGACPIHPLRLMAEIRAWLDRDAVLVEDGHDTLGFCRHTLHTHVLGHRMNPGVLGNVGVGVPVALGAKAARPDTQVVLVSGDSAFGWNGMEMASCCLQDLPIVVVVLNNAGITARSREAPMMPGQDLGHVDYQRVCEAFGGHGERVEDPAEIRPALERAMASGRPAVVNVIVDPFVPSATHVGFAGVMSESYSR
ncbi:MAG: thiamine pyrophosphate-binding protein [Proteobacteria bacterium]|nr:thiamine pyrophosphate-binding protein [Pseudomonadota bacterium]